MCVTYLIKIKFVINRPSLKVTQTTARIIQQSSLSPSPDMCRRSDWLRTPLFQRLGMSGLRRCYGDCDGMRRWKLEGSGGGRDGAWAPARRNHAKFPE